MASLLTTGEDLALILENHLKRLERAGVVYAEFRISPSVWEYFGLQAVATAEFLLSLNIDTRVRYNFIVEAVRHWDAKLIERDLDLALRFPGIVKGFGLGGDETRAPIEGFSSLFDECKSRGIAFIPHAGEVTGPGEVRKAVELGARRIGHGIGAVGDTSLCEELRREGVHLEVCPTSNFITGAVPVGEPHPVKELHERGVDFSVSTDDPGLFLTTVKKELYVARKTIGDKCDLLALQRSALEASLLSGQEKEFLLLKYFT